MEDKIILIILIVTVVPEAVLPTEGTTVSNELLSNTDNSQDEIVIDEIKEGKKKITNYDVLEQQFKALLAKQENLALKKRKLNLEVYLLEQKVFQGDTTSLTE